MITYPLEGLDMNSFVIDKQPTSSYNIDPSEFYQEQDYSIYSNKNQLLVEPQDNVDNPPMIYDLYGVVNHYGSQNFGHYTSFCKLNDGNWANFDDNRVTKCNKEEVVSKAAYVLFYKRRDSH